MRICCCRELFLLQTQRIIGQGRYILKIIFISLEILFTVHSHFAWLSCKHVTQVYRYVRMIINIIFHHSQSLCVAGLQWRMIIALAVAITLGDWLLNMCGPSSSLRLTFLLFLCYVYIHHYCSLPPTIISAIRMVLECWYTERQTVLHTSNDYSIWFSHLQTFPDLPVNMIGQGHWIWNLCLCLMKVTLFIDCFMCLYKCRPWTSYIGVLSLDKIINHVTVRTV